MSTHAHEYASLFNSWHIGTMGYGYGLVLSRSFEDEQFRRTNQGLRRMLPSKRIDRAAHPVELNAPVLRGSLSLSIIYKLPGLSTNAHTTFSANHATSSGASQATAVPQ